MSQCVTLRSIPPSLPGIANLPGLLALLQKLQQLAAPLATADGLRQAIELLVQFGAAAGLNPAWLARLESLLSNTSGFNTVLSIIAYLESLGGSSSSSGRPVGASASPATAELAIDAQSLVDWLPIVIQILQLIQSIRGGS
ncbi:MAG TPA: hypothetical protein VHX65_01170 [Pirellulales bacterium]|nr:hypothetical protein [Pirellulales bacterium]